MKFGWMTLSLSPTPAEDLASVHQQLDQGVFAEAMGFDYLWLTEHNFTGECAYADRSDSLRRRAGGADVPRADRVRRHRDGVAPPRSPGHPARRARQPEPRAPGGRHRPWLHLQRVRVHGVRAPE